MQVNSPSATSGGAVSLRLLVPFLALFGAVLTAFAGLPHTPDPGLAVPDLSTVEALLRSSRPPLDGAIYVVGLVGWCIWGWLVLSLHPAACRRWRRAPRSRDSRGSPVPHSRGRSERSVCPQGRTRILGRHHDRPGCNGGRTRSCCCTARSFNSRPGWRSTDRGAGIESNDILGSADEPAGDVPAGSVVYTVQSGDNLARIAERFYADGDKWQVLYQANQGRRMKTAQRSIAQESSTRAGV